MTAYACASLTVIFVFFILVLWFVSYKFSLILFGSILSFIGIMILMTKFYQWLGFD